MEIENDSSGRTSNDAAMSQQPQIAKTPTVPLPADNDLESASLPIDANDPSAGSTDFSKEDVPFADVADDTNAAQKAFSPVGPIQFQNVAAKGGAVAAVTLGLLTIFGAFITQWSIFNAAIGLALGVWGLSSPLKRTAWIGLTLCLAGLLMCLSIYSNA